MTELISRQAALAAIDKNRQELLQSGMTGAEHILVHYGRRVIEELPTAEQRCGKERGMSEWEIITKRPMDEEERKEWEEMQGEKLDDDDAFMFCNLPDDDTAVLVCTKFGHVYIDTLYRDVEGGSYFEENGDLDGIVAWMPLPKPYKAESSESAGELGKFQNETDEGIKLGGYVDLNDPTKLSEMSEEECDDENWYTELDDPKIAERSEE